MGSDSDLPTMHPAVQALQDLGVSVEVRVLSAHRTPLEMVAFAQQARDQGFGVIVAGAGGAAHLPGMVASLTTLPVIGVPVKSRALSGVDSLHSIVQMPGGIPVATVAIGGGLNAGLLAARFWRWRMRAWRRGWSLPPDPARHRGGQGCTPGGSWFHRLSGAHAWPLIARRPVGALKHCPQ